MIGASTPDPAEPKSLALAKSPSRQCLTVFEKKHVTLASDLSIANHLRATLEEIITRNGGIISTNVSRADMLICKYREGREYKIASRAGKDVGNLAWLYYLLTHNTWTSPLRRLLHYPIAKEGIPGFKNLRISLSNYSGDARVYLENLITAAGAECTKTLKQDNTHLITAHDKSEKCQAAQEWGIHLINHLWLEESYAKWTKLSVSASRYTYFPPRTNLGEVVGQTRIDRHAVEQQFFPPNEDIEMEDGKGKMQDDAEADLAGAVPPSSIIRSPRASEEAQGSSKLVKTQQPELAESRKLSESTKLRTPSALRFVAIGKENVTPSTTSSRKSKEKAAARLHDIVPDIALYEKEKKRVGGVVYGGRRKGDDKPSHTRKRSVDQDVDDEVEDIGTGAKRQKKAREAPIMTLLISGYKKWVGHTKIEDEDRVSFSSLFCRWKNQLTSVPGKTSRYGRNCDTRTVPSNPSCSAKFGANLEICDSPCLCTDHPLDNLH